MRNNSFENFNKIFSEMYKKNKNKIIWKIINKRIVCYTINFHGI